MIGQARIRAELKICAHSSRHHCLQVPFLLITKAVSTGLVHSTQDLRHALPILLKKPQVKSDDFNRL